MCLHVQVKARVYDPHRNMETLHEHAISKAQVTPPSSSPFLLPSPLFCPLPSFSPLSSLPVPCAQSCAVLGGCIRRCSGRGGRGGRARGRPSGCTRRSSSRSCARARCPRSSAAASAPRSCRPVCLCATRLQRQSASVPRSCKTVCLCATRLSGPRASRRGVCAQSVLGARW